MRYELKDDVLTFFLEGAIDTITCTEIEEEIQKICAAESHSAVVLDIDEVNYVSSAGLRIILRLKKREKEVSIINANIYVYETLDMTGFTDILPVSKAYRKLSVDGCEVIGQGSNGIVYRYSPDIIVKVYRNSDALDAIQRERELARAAFVMGVNTAIPYDVVKVGDKYGSVFELLSAKSLTKLILQESGNFDEYVKVFTDMLKNIHGTHVKPGLLPKSRDAYLNYAEFLKNYLDTARYEKLRGMIEAVPDSDGMIHGDYHTNNVHYANGESILIDMDTLSCGDPVFEFASIYLAFVGFNELDCNASMKFMGLSHELCRRIYDRLMRDYFATDDEAHIDALNDRIRVLAYTRLLRRTIRRQSDRPELIGYVKASLIDSIDRVVSLSLSE